MRKTKCIASFIGPQVISTDNIHCALEKEPFLRGTVVLQIGEILQKLFSSIKHKKR